MASMLGFGKVDEHRENPGTSALGGMCFGVLLFAGSLGLIGWNEKRAVYRAKTIDKARDEYVDLDSCVPSPEYNDKLVVFTCAAVAKTDYSVSDLDYTSGLLSASELAGRPLTQTPADPVLSWKRKAQGFTRLEHCEKDKDDKSKTSEHCTYTTTGWTSSAPRYEGPQPSPPAYPSWVKDVSADAGLMCVGDTKGNVTAPCNESSTDAWLITSGSWGFSTIDKIGSPRELALYSNETYSSMGGSSDGAQVCSGYLQTNKSSCASPHPAFTNDPGDYRFSWTARVRMPDDTVTYMALQTFRNGQYVLEEWQNPDYSDCSYCTIGEFRNNDPANGKEILDELESSNKVITWVLRFAGWLLCWFAMQLCVAPIAMFPRMLPLVGDFIGGIVDQILCCVTCLFATGISLLVMAIAWLAFRPMIGIPLLAACLLGCSGAIFLVVQMRKKRKQKQAAPPLLDGDAAPQQSYSPQQQQQQQQQQVQGGGAALPPGWQHGWDQNANRSYYIFTDPMTGQTRSQWEHPSATAQGTVC